MAAAEVQAAFQAGLRGQPYQAASAAHGLAEAPAAWAAGPNESLLAGLSRLPGLSEPRAAYATGRALSRILQLFDQAGAPASIGRQFLDNLAAAVAAERLRGQGASWGGADTVGMFIEMYTRILGERADLARIEGALLEHALSDPAQRGRRSGRGLLAGLRRARG